MRQLTVWVMLLSALILAGCSEGNSIRPDFFGLKGRDGAAEARRDIAKGTPFYKAYGLPHPATTQYAVLLKKRMNITYETLAGCMVDEYLLKYADRYNTVIVEYAAKKYGANAMGELWNEAVKEYEATEKARP